MRAIYFACRETLPQNLLNGARLAGAYLEGQAKALCVVDTGRLRNSITHDVVLTSKTISIIVGTNVEYAPYAEFGTGPVGEESTAGKNTGISIQYRKTGWIYPTPDGGFRYTKGQPARPFLYPALLLGKNNAISILVNALKRR